jgi:hypothetical protein
VAPVILAVQNHWQTIKKNQSLNIPFFAINQKIPKNGLSDLNHNGMV